LRHRKILKCKKLRHRIILEAEIMRHRKIWGRVGGVVDVATVKDVITVCEEIFDGYWLFLLVNHINNQLCL
jgi:hypothetical protein